MSLLLLCFDQVLKKFITSLRGLVVKYILPSSYIHPSNHQAYQPAEQMNIFDGVKPGNGPKLRLTNSRPAATIRR